MAFFRFKVTYWDTFEERKTMDSGFIFGEGYAGAATKLVQWYGDDLISIDLLYETDNDIVLLDNAINEIFKAEGEKEIFKVTRL